ncbi:hypothetical protein OSH58_12380, partial [Mycobacterium ulcerans]
CWWRGQDRRGWWRRRNRCYRCVRATRRIRLTWLRAQQVEAPASGGGLYLFLAFIRLFAAAT